MNVAFFLTPKSEVVTLDKSMSIGQAMDIMEKHRYTSVPVIDSKGRYTGTLSEGDLLWYFKSQKMRYIDELEHQSIRKVKRHYRVEAVSIDSDIDSLIELASMQGFVPVVDDSKTFIGIIKRSDIIQYGMSKQSKEQMAMLA